MKRLQDRTAVVTGGASGIGLATARRLAAEGAAVAVVDLDPRRTEEAAEALRGAGARALGVAADVTRGEDLAAAYSRAARELGPLRVVVNSAGIVARGRLDDTSVEEWQRVIDVDLTSMFHSARAARHLLAQAGGGSIINIASVAGLRGAVNVAYVAAKGGVIALTRQLAGELAPLRVRVNSVSPGFVATPLNEALRAAGEDQGWNPRIPLGRYGEADEIGAVCAFLASDDASYITGADLVVDGGLSAVLAPAKA